MKRFHCIKLTFWIVCIQILCTLQTFSQTVPNAQNGFGGIVIFTSTRIVAPSTPDPSGTIGWNIYRKAKNEAAWKQLNTKPVQRSADKQDFERLYGVDFLKDIVQLQEATSENEAWSRIQATTERSTAQVKSLFLDPRAVVPFGEAFVDSTAELGKEYEYAVAPVSTNGEGAKQARGSATRQPPPELTVLMGTKVKSQDSSSVEVRWSVLSKRGTIAGFEVLRSEVVPGGATSGKQTPMRSLGLVLGASAQTFTDTDVRYGAVYNYLVVPFDAFLNKEARTDTVYHVHAVVKDLQ